MTIKVLDPLDIDISSGTQARVSIKPTTVTEYAEAMKNGDLFPSPVVFAEEGSERYVLADGFHTRMAHMEAFKDKGIACDVRDGTIFDAKLYASGANHSHGIRRRDKDIHNAIKMLLLDMHTEGWADTVLADYAKCDRRTVKKVREKLIISGALEKTEKRKHKQGDKTVEVKTNKDKKTGTSKKKDKEEKGKDEPKKKTQDEYDREDIITAIDTLRTVVCSGAEALERYKLHRHLVDAEFAMKFLDELVSSSEDSGADEAFLAAGKK